VSSLAAGQGQPLGKSKEREKKPSSFTSSLLGCPFSLPWANREEEEEQV